MRVNDQKIAIISTEQGRKISVHHILSERFQFVDS